MFREIATDDFPPFGKARFSFPAAPENTPPNLAEVHLLTGVNGTGKTRLLCLLAAALGNPEPLKKRIKGIRRMEMTFEPIAAQQSKARLVEGGFGWVTGGKIQQWAPHVPAFAYGGMAYVADAPITILARARARPRHLPILQPPRKPIRRAPASHRQPQGAVRHGFPG